MILHKDKQVFDELVTVVAQTVGLPEVYIEKDYWVTNALRLLSEFTRADEVVFKGGTSLSKAYKLIHRFSEDIDLVIFSQGMSQNAGKILLKQVETAISHGLIYLKGDVRESKGSQFRKTVYKYPRSIEETNFGQASPELLIEINAFSNPEPFKKIELQTLIAEILVDQDRHDIVEQYSLHGFFVNVLSVKRTLVEKILGMIKDSYDKNPLVKLSNRIRHLYDICLILKHDKYRDFITGTEFKRLCDLCILDERILFQNSFNIFSKPLKQAPLFSEFKNWSKSLSPTYTGVFADLVYRDLPSMNEIEETLEFIHDNLYL